MKSKVSKFEIQEPFKGQKSAFVAFEDKSWGHLNYDGAPPDIKVGDEIEFDLVVEGKKHKLSLKSGATPPPQSSPASSTPAPSGKFIAPPHSQVDIMKWKFDSRMLVCELTHKLILEGKLSDSEAKLHLVAWCTEMDNLIDGIFA